GWLREISDNDGGNTSHYVTAMALKYAVTGDEQARQQAVDAFKAMVWLDDITPKPGFIARAIWSVKGDKGERSTRGSGGLPAKWYPTDDGLWQWKGDTSSKEVKAQTYMHTAFALTGDKKFQQGLEQLLKWHYQTYTVRQRLTFPPDQVAPWDDELAFFCYHPLLSYARDPELRSIYLRSLERSWEI